MAKRKAKKKTKQKKEKKEFKMDQYKKRKPSYEQMTEEGLAGDVADAEYEEEERESML